MTYINLTRVVATDTKRKVVFYTKHKLYLRSNIRVLAT